MEEYDVKRFALVLAIQAEIEGMKAENVIRLSNGQALTYDEDSFLLKAEKLRDLSYCHNYQL